MGPNNMMTKQVIVIAVLATVLNAIPAIAGNIAVVVGVDYAKAGHKWAADATMVSAALAFQGWTVTTVNGVGGTPEPTKANIINAITSANVGAGDSFMFYYSGHGSYLLEPNQEDPGVGPSPPRDRFDETLWLGGAPAVRNFKDDELTALLEGPTMPAAAKKLVFLDCCYSGGFWNGESAASPAGGDKGDLENVPKTTLIAAAEERHKAPGSSDISHNFKNYVNNHGFDLGGMNAAQLETMFETIKVNSPVWATRKGDPLFEPEDYDPLSFDDVEEHYGGGEYDQGGFFFTNLVNIPEPATIVLVGLGSLVFLRRRRGFALDGRPSCRASGT